VLRRVVVDQQRLGQLELVRRGAVEQTESIFDDGGYWVISRYADIKEISATATCGPPTLRVP